MSYSPAATPEDDAQHGPRAVLRHLASHLPPLVARTLAADPRLPIEPRLADLDAAVLFADVSGFTPLAERLAAQGTGGAGAEHLSRALNAYFGPVIDLIAAHGGEIVDFAGDAVLAAWFTGAAGEDLASVTRCAARAAIELRDRLGDYEAAPDVRLSMKTALAAGRVRFCDVEGAGGRRHVFLAGAPLGELAEAGKRVGRGAVLAAPSAWALLAGRARGRPDDGGGAHLDQVAADPPVAAPQPPTPGAEAEAVLRSYVPRPVLDVLDAGQRSWMAQLRRLSVVFVNVLGLEPDRPAHLDMVQTLVGIVTGTAARLGGMLDQVLLGDKGTTLLVSWGLPGLAHEDDAARALQAAVDVQSELVRLGIAAGIGVATGRVFCGECGNASRRRYVTLGQTVNVAARLMEAAAGSVLCDEASRTGATARGAPPLAFDASPRFALKGSAEPLVVYRVRGLAPQPSSLFGRDAERAALCAGLDAFGRDRSGRLIVVEGEPGIGKSRLVTEMETLVRRRGLSSLVGGGSAIESAAPYHAWRPVFRDLLDLDALPAEPTTRRELVQARVTGLDPSLAELAPLLNAVVPLDFPDSALTAEMQGESRADSTNRLLARVLAAHAGDGDAPGCVVFLEDAHWFDSASWSLVREVVRGVPVLVVLTSRLQDDAIAHERRDLAAAERTLWVRPQPLPLEATAAVLRERLGVETIGPEVVELVHARAGGNPFFIEELAYALRDTGLLVVAGGICRLVTDRGDVSHLVPESVESTVAARIDQLPPQFQLTLKVASVFGQVFSLGALVDVHPVEADRPAIAGALETLTRLGLTVRDQEQHEITYRFRHAITHQVTYGLLLFAQRRALHQVVAEWYERGNAGRLESVYPILAHHWRRADVAPKAIDYLDRAGAQALEADANEEALRFFGEASALEATAAAGEATALGRARRDERMARAQYRLGAFGTSDDLCREALALIDQPVPRSAARLLAGGVALIADQVARRLGLLGRSRRADPATRDRVLLSHRTHLMLTYVAFINSDTNLTLYGALRSLQTAEIIGPSPELGCAYASICGAAGLVPLRRVARAYERRALATLRAIDAGTSLAAGQARSRIAVFTSGVGDWTASQRHLDEATAIFARLGEWAEWGACMQMVGRAAASRGDFAALALIADRLEAVALRRGARMELAWSMNNRAESILWSSNDVRRALDLCRQVVTLLAGTRHATSVGIAESLAGVGELRAGNVAAARAAARRALTILRDMQATSFGLLVAYAATADVLLACWEAEPDADPAQRREAAAACRRLGRLAALFPVAGPAFGRCAGLRAWLLGRPRRAERLWRTALARAEALGMRWEVGAAHLELGRHGRDDVARAHLDAALAIFQELGVEHDRGRAAAARAAADPEGTER